MTVCARDCQEHLLQISSRNRWHPKDFQHILPMTSQLTAFSNTCILHYRHCCWKSIVRDAYKLRVVRRCQNEHPAAVLKRHARPSDGLGQSACVERRKTAFRCKRWRHKLSRYDFDIRTCEMSSARQKRRCVLFTPLDQCIRFLLHASRSSANFLTPCIWGICLYGCRQKSRSLKSTA